MMSVLVRIVKYLWEYYNLSNNDKEHMEALRRDIVAFENWLTIHNYIDQ